jgi:hypothetical protein
VRRSQYYATAGRGAQNYYTLTSVGYRLLYGDEATPPTKRYFGDIGVANHHHTRCLADFIVHTTVAAHRAGVRLANFYRENTLYLEVGDERLYPDCAFQLITAEGRAFSYFVELDNGSERVESEKPIDSWERKIRLYDSYQDGCPQRFRVLIVTTRRQERLTHIMDTAVRLASNPHRSLFYGVLLPRYLATHSPVTSASFVNHRGETVSLVPRFSLRNAHEGQQSPLTAPAAREHSPDALAVC